MLALPIKLLPEEVLLLIENDIAELIKYENITTTPTAEDDTILNNLSQQLLEEEKTVYHRLRKEELERTVDKIILGKRKHGDERSREDILKNELNKSSNVTEETMVWPIFMEHSAELRGSI